MSDFALGACHLSEFAKHAFWHSAPSVLNSLPVSVIRSDSLPVFKYRHFSIQRLTSTYDRTDHRTRLWKCEVTIIRCYRNDYWFILSWPDNCCLAPNWCRHLTNGTKHTCHLWFRLLSMKTWRHPQNRKYITYHIAIGGGPSHVYRYTYTGMLMTILCTLTRGKVVTLSFICTE